jgi:hypothetical protein
MTTTLFPLPQGFILGNYVVDWSPVTSAKFCENLSSGSEIGAGHEDYMTIA